MHACDQRLTSLPLKAQAHMSHVATCIPPFFWGRKYEISGPYLLKWQKGATQKKKRQRWQKENSILTRSSYRFEFSHERRIVSDVVFG